MANSNTNQISANLAGTTTTLDSEQKQNQIPTAEVYPDNGNGTEAEVIA